LSEFDEELQFHLEREMETHVARGRSPDEARRAALRDFGGVTQAREQVREVRAWGFEPLWRDTRQAARALRATPGFTSVAVAILSLSVGAAIAAFSIVDAVLIRRLPFPDADRLIAVREAPRTDPMLPGWDAPQNFYDWRRRQHVFTGLAASAYGEITIKLPTEDFPQHLPARQVTANLFDVLRTPPVIGRAFGVEHEIAGRQHVAVISYDLWQRRFGGTADVVGKQLPGQLATFDILGVMPKGFSFPVDAGERVDVWVPLVLPPDARIRGNDFGYYLEVIGRLRPGVTLTQAQADIDRITAQLTIEAPRWFADRIVRVERLQDYVALEVRTWMYLLVAAMACVLAVATVNLGNLMLARGLSRTRELGIRAALGASRAALARVLLTESFLLSFLGTSAGAFLAWMSIDSIRGLLPPNFPRLAGIGMNARVVATTFLMAAATGVGFGLAPVVQLTRAAGGRFLGPSQRLATADRSSTALRSVLMTVEVMLATVLLVGATLFFASFARVSRIDLGFDYHDVLTVRLRPMMLPGNRAPGAIPLLRVLERVQALPPVQVAALAGEGLPLRGDIQTRDFTIPDKPGVSGDIGFNAVSPSYFGTLGIPLLSGRAFDARDTPDTPPVMLLNARAARQFFGDERAVGRRIRWRGALGERAIVGVVGDIRFMGPEYAVRPQAFIPFAQSLDSAATLIVRAPVGTNLLPAIGKAVSAEFSTAVMPPLAIDVQTLEYYYRSRLAERRLNMWLLSVFGFLGAIIAAVGIYGVIAYLVAQRTHEIGIRRALGAQSWVILRMVLGRTSAHVAVGIAVGLVTSWFLSTTIGALLFDIRPHDAFVYATVAGMLLVIGMAAAVIPARRATSVDPLVALRLE
jgi:putative ABC transport system permease protein